MLYKLTAAFLSSILQTVLYGLLLLLAYYFWTAPNASLIIGTAFPIVLLLFFVLTFFQSWLTFTAKINTSFIVFIVLTVFFVLPFVTNFTWISPLLVACNAMILYSPILMRKKVSQKQQLE
jgi:hypothetical protein